MAKFYVVESRTRWTLHETHPLIRIDGDYPKGLKILEFDMRDGKVIWSKKSKRGKK